MSKVIDSIADLRLVTSNTAAINSIDLTSDLDKPVSTATQIALDVKAGIVQTSTTNTTYTDATTATNYKLYIDNGEIVMEEL